MLEFREDIARIEGTALVVVVTRIKNQPVSVYLGGSEDMHDTGLPVVRDHVHVGEPDTPKQELGQTVIAHAGSALRYHDVLQAVLLQAVVVV